MEVQVNGDKYNVLHIIGTHNSEVWKNGKKYMYIYFTDDTDRKKVTQAVKLMITRERQEIRDTQPGQQFTEVKWDCFKDRYI